MNLKTQYFDLLELFFSHRYRLLSLFISTVESDLLRMPLLNHVAPGFDILSRFCALIFLKFIRLNALVCQQGLIYQSLRVRLLLCSMFLKLLLCVLIINLGSRCCNDLFHIIQQGMNFYECLLASLQLIFFLLVDVESKIFFYLSLTTQTLKFHQIYCF
mgnify:CR=1 FL=1